MARPPKYTDTDKPVSVSLRIPRQLYDQAQHHAHMRRTTLTALIVEGLRMRLETPLDPRDIVASRDDTVMQELQQMIDARIHAALAVQAILTPTPAQSTPRLSHGRNITAIQGNVTSPQRRRGRPGTMRQRILDLLRQHIEGLTAEQIRAHLNITQPIGDVLQGMRRQYVVRTERTGHTLRYFALPS